MVKAKKLDRRIQRSRRALREALIALILEKGYDSITVQDITDKADLNRGTLYLHYRDKQELLLSSINEVYDELLAQFIPITARNREDMNIPEKHLTIVFQHVVANADFYRVMLGKHGVPAFIARLRQIVTQVSLERLTAIQQLTKASPIPPDFVASYAGGAVIGVIEWWLENNMPMSPETMAHYTLGLTVNGLYQMMGLEKPPL